MTTLLVSMRCVRKSKLGCMSTLARVLDKDDEARKECTRALPGAGTAPDERGSACPARVARGAAAGDARAGSPPRALAVEVEVDHWYLLGRLSKIRYLRSQPRLLH